MTKETRGGKREGAGRKPKSEERALIEKLEPMSDKVFATLEDAIVEGKSWALKLWFEYSHGKPRETKDITLTSEQPIFNLGDE